MPLTIFNKNWLRCAAWVGMASVSNSVVAAGIPVMDAALIQGTGQGFQMTGENIRVQTEALVNALDYSTKAIAGVIVDTETNSVRTQRGLDVHRDYTPEVSKPAGACTSYAVAGSRASASAAGRVGAPLAQHSHQRNLRAARLVADVPRAELAHTEAIRRLQDPKSTSTVTVFESTPFTEKEYKDVMDTVLYATNPIPQPVPNQKELDIIEQHGSPENKSSYARVLVHADRLKRMQQVLMNQKDKDLQVYDPDAFKYLFNEDNLSDLADSYKQMLSGRLSKNQIDELMANYRVESAEWVKRIHTGGDRAVLNDVALMQAENLKLLWSISQSLETLISVTAQAEANRLNQVGATEF